MIIRNVICIECPIGCNIKIVKDEDGYKISGNSCKRGYEYAVREMEDPKRVLTTTVKLNNSYLKRLPVRSSSEIPKRLIFECMNILKDIEVSAPIRAGQVIVENILNTGADIIASRSVEDKIEL